jgi:hypothetical protein
MIYDPPSSLRASDPCPPGGLMIALADAFDPDALSVIVTVANVYELPGLVITIVEIVLLVVFTLATALAPVPFPVIDTVIVLALV